MMFVNQNADAYDRETEEYIVAYLDLLGVTNRIKDYSQDELSMNKLHNCKLRSNGMPVPLLRNGYSIFNGTKYR